MASRSLGTLTLDVIAQVGGFVAGMDKAERSSEKWRKQVEKNARAVGAAVGTGIAAGITALTAMTIAAVNSGAEISNLASVANVSTSDFQKLAVGAKTVGVEQDKLADILKDVNDKVGDFLNTGGGGMKDFFDQIAPKVGVTADQFRNLSGSQALGLYVSSLEKAKVSQSDMTFYLEAVASDVTALLPLLRNNSEGFKRFGEAAEAAGSIMDEKTIRAAQELKAANWLVEQSISGLGNQITSAMLPTLANFATRLSDTTINGVLAKQVSDDLAASLRALGMLRSTCRAAAASCNFPGTYSVIGRKVTEKSCTESFFDRFSVLNANLTHTHELFSNPPQVCQGEQRGQLSRVFHQPTKTYFHVTKLPLDHAKRMLDLGPCLSLAELDLALGFVQYAALVQLGIGAATRCNLPDHPPIFMLFAPFDTGVTGICIHGVFFAMQQFSHLRDIGHIGSGAMDVMHQAGLDIGTDVRLHPEEILTAFLGLVHLGITLAFFIFGRAGGMNNGGIDDGALAQRQAFFLQITIDDRKDCRCELMLLQQVPEVHDRGVFGDWRAQRQECELAHGRDFVERFFHGRVAQGEPVLQQMDAQHGFQRIGFSTAAGLGVERFDQLQQACPGHHLIHFGEEALSAGLLALAGVLKVGKAHLAHGRLGSGVAGILA